jgi:hypothetical protein
MSRYASQTSVSAEKSRAEIESMLTRYGATAFMSGWQGNNAVVGFSFANRTIRFELKMPAKDLKEFTHTPGRGTKRHPDDAYASWEQATRQRWRALLLLIKAKLEAVESGISVFEQEFLANVVVPGGQTVGQWIAPRLDELACASMGQMAKLLPGLGEGGR